MKPALVLTAALWPALAGAETLKCGPFDVTFSDTACGITYVDGVLKAAGDARVCEISNPQLRILTVAADLSFVYEDTDDDRVTRGTCVSR
ncbi:hypothetical protein [Roseicyclus sp.]|uniref:hypothetical protein n=1 Tax=Roseicyclus sp. TaxID=1914329 RepID=UPI001BCE3856|nr:hypothetical protein [Roseicyclus sp.]